MAEDLTLTESEPSPGPPPPEPHPAHRRFRSVIVALAVAGGIALIVAGALAGAPTHADAVAGWSSWKPSSSGSAAAQQIADHVGPSYKGSDGRQLVAVTGGDLKVADLPVHIAVRGAGGSGNINLVQGSGILYTLCGLGAHCSIATGKPSAQRMLLLRREALELALYTFKYTDVDNVAVLMPPRPGERTVTSAAGKKTTVGNQGTAMLFQRKNLEPLLNQPLAQSVPATVPTIKTIAAAPDSLLIDRLTAADLFLVSIVQGQDATAYLVLDPLSS